MNSKQWFITGSVVTFSTIVLMYDIKTTLEKDKLKKHKYAMERQSQERIDNFHREMNNYSYKTL
mgnify:CR=1 FL=1